MNFKERLGHLPSTVLGLVAAGTTAAGGALGCQLPLTSWKVWGPAVLLAVWGGLIQGPPKQNGAPASSSPLRILIPLAFVGLFSGCALFAGPGASPGDIQKMVEIQNMRGCVYFRGSATPWASVTALMVGTWGSDPPSYEKCWIGLPPGIP